MIFGNPHDFATEARLEPDIEPPSAVWGRMCIHAGGYCYVMGGYRIPHSSLCLPYGNFKDLSNEVETLWDLAFNNLQPQVIHDLVRQAIYGEDERN